MAQYTTGTVSITNGSAIITGSGTDWNNVLNNIKAGDLFVPAGSSVHYTVSSVDSATQITLTGAITDATQSGINYVITRDFTANIQAPLLGSGDTQTGKIFNAAMQRIDNKLTDGTLAASFGSLVVAGALTVGGILNITDEITFAYGSAADPSIAWADDNDTGFYGSSAAIHATVSGVRRATIDANGIYIRPEATAGLYVQGGTGQAQWTLNTDTTNSNWVAKLLDAAGSPYTWDDRDSAISVHYDDVDNYIWRSTLGTEIMRKDNAGLHIGATSGSGRKFSVTNSSTSDIALFEGPTTGGQITIYRGSSYGWDLGIDASSNFFIGPDSGQRYFTLASTGNLTHQTAGNTIHTVKSTFANSTTTGIYVDTTGDGSLGRINFAKAGVTRGGVYFNHNASATYERLGFNVASSEVLSVFGGGTVAINELAPSTNANLHITAASGHIYLEESDASADNKVWTFQANGELFQLQTRSDAYGFQANVLNLDRDGQFRSALGSATAPTYSFDGDTDTGIFRATTNELGFAVAGSEAMRIQNTGTISVGASGAGAGQLYVYRASGIVLELQRDDNGIILELDGNGYSAFHTLDGGAYVIGHNSSGRGLALQTNSTTRLFIAADGDVMIGTTSQSGALAVFDDSGDYHINVVSTLYPAELRLAGGGSGYAHASILMESTVGVRGQGTYLLNTANGSEWFFGSAYNDTDAFTVARYVTGGHVDQTADQANGLFRVDNTGRIENTATNDTIGAYVTAIANTFLDFTPSLNTAYSTLVVKGNNNGYAGITIASPNSNNETGALAFADTGGGYQGLISYYHATDSMAFFTNSAHAMTLTSAGNLALGTTGASYLLHASRATANTTETIAIQNTHATGASAQIRIDTASMYVQNILYNSGSYYHVTNAGTYYLGGASGNSTLVFQTGGAEFMRGTSGQTVTLGGTATGGKLQVVLATSASFGGSWSSSWAAFGGDGSSAGALGIGYDDTNGAKIQVVDPGTAWKNLEIGARRFEFFRSGATSEFIIHENGGVVLGAPTGGNKGTGTLNATAVYDDNTLLTDLVLDQYVDGEFDRQKYENHPVAEELSDDWFNIDWYAKFFRDNRFLPGMVSWAKPEDKPSQGTLISRLTAVVETQAALIEQLHDRLTALEAKVA